MLALSAKLPEEDFTQLSNADQSNCRRLIWKLPKPVQPDYPNPLNDTQALLARMIESTCTYIHVTQAALPYLVFLMGFPMSFRMSCMSFCTHIPISIIFTPTYIPIN